MPVGRYRISNATIAIFVEDSCLVARMVPQGAAIQIHSKTLDDDGLVRVTWDGKKAMMFAQHLRSRSELVHARWATA